MDKEKACCHITTEAIYITKHNPPIVLEKRLKIGYELSKDTW